MSFLKKSDEVAKRCAFCNKRINSDSDRIYCCNYCTAKAAKQRKKEKQNEINQSRQESILRTSGAEHPNGQVD